MKNPICIFIVDDDHDFAKSMADIMELHGYDVQTAHSGEEAVSKFRDQDFDVTFMDVKMPGKNGVESFLEIRKLKPDAKVVMITAYSVEQLLEKAIRSGACGILHKPFDMEKATKMIEKLRGRNGSIKNNIK